MLPQQDLRNQVGQDPLIQYLNSVGMPVTRENYLSLMFPEGLPEMTSEVEQMLPENLRLDAQE